jgi:hypothetical protein
MDGLIADAGAAQAIPAQVLEHIAAAIPQRSLALAKTAATVRHRLAGNLPMATLSASWLSNVSARLACPWSQTKPSS